MNLHSQFTIHFTEYSTRRKLGLGFIHKELTSHSEAKNNNWAT